MKANSLIALTLLSTTLGACTGDQGGQLPPMTADSSTDDSISNFEIDPVYQDQAHIGELSRDGTLIEAVTVSYAPGEGSKDMAIVEGTLVTLDASAKEITIEVGEPEWSLLGAGFRFLFYTRPAGSDAEWQPYQFVYPGKNYATFSVFNRVSVLVDESQVRYDPEGDGFAVNFHNELPADGASLEYAVFVVPSFRLFGTLEGSHEYELSVSCDGAPCKAPAAD